MHTAIQSRKAITINDQVACEGGSSTYGQKGEVEGNDKEVMVMCFGKVDHC
jgi:hypothetical protein